MTTYDKEVLLKAVLDGKINPGKSIAGGPASVTTYDKKILLKAVLDGKINPGKVFTKTYDLDQINEAYQDMVDRKVIKSYIKVSD